MKKTPDPGYVRNILALMQLGQSERARFAARMYDGRVEQFLGYIELNTESIVAIAEGDAETAEKKFHEVFLYGWLNPKGEFIPVAFAQHEATVQQITGHNDCDLACEAGWVKFTIGLPYDYNGECLFDDDFCDRRRLSRVQKDWMNKWLTSICDPATSKPFF